MTTDPSMAQSQPKPEGGGEGLSHLYELVVGAGDRLFPLDWIPMQTARAVHERSSPGSSTDDSEDRSTHVVELTRRCHGEDGEDGDGNVSLRASHWEELHRVWSQLPPFRLPISEVAFEPYQRALTAARPPLGWELDPMFTTFGHALEVLARATELSHRELLKRRILDGSLVALDGVTSVPVVGEWRANAVLTLEGLQAFARPLLIRVVVRQVSDATGAELTKVGTGVEQRKRLLEAFKRFGVLAPTEF